MRAIFHRYLQLRSVHRLVEVLAAEGVVSKRYVTLKGIQVGGGVFSRGALFHLLCNRTYLGEIVHKRDVYPGAHPAIVDRELFDQAQALLAIGRSTSDRRKVKVGTSPLKGLLFDADGEAMSPTFSQGSTGKRYRYYVSTSLQKGSKSADTSATINRIAAPALEALLRERLTRLAPSVADLARAAAGGVLLRVDALPSSLSLTLRADAAPNWVADPEASLARLRARLHADERVWVEPGEPRAAAPDYRCISSPAGRAHILRRRRGRGAESPPAAGPNSDPRAPGRPCQARGPRAAGFAHHRPISICPQPRAGGVPGARHSELHPSG